MNKIVDIEHDDKKGRIYIKADDKEAGEMTFIFEDSDHFVIKHTDVKPEFNGKGFGKLLVGKAVEYARDNGLKIIPLCPFAKSVFDKVPVYQDVLKKN